MLFRSTCSWPFSVENPLRVATEALNIHLVSCILYLEDAYLVSVEERLIEPHVNSPTPESVKDFTAKEFLVAD